MSSSKNNKLSIAHSVYNISYYRYLPYSTKYQSIKIKTILLLFALLLTIPVYSQFSVIDSIAQLPASATIKEKIKLKQRVEVLFEQMKSSDEKKILLKQFTKIAAAKNDSIFLISSYYLNEDRQKLKETSRKYGFHLEEYGSEQSLYNALNIFHDKKGMASFEDIRKNDQLFEYNQTRDATYEYDPNEVYWGKIILHGNSTKKADQLIHFSPNQYFTSWLHIDTWMVYQNDSIAYHKTGDQFSDEEKPIPSKLNMLRYNIPQAEKVVLYFRVQGMEKEKMKKPTHLDIFLLEEEHWPGFFPNYPFKGKYHLNSSGRSFNTNVLVNHDFYIDSSQIATIDDIVANQEILAWKDASKIQHEADKVYWIKTRLYGSPYFNGEQILHISPWSRRDVFSFDYTEVYIADGQGGYHYQKTGDHVPVKERSYAHWCNFIKLNIGLADTLDLWIRLEGADERYLAPNREITISHVDPYSLFPSQSNHAIFNGIYFGILAIQCLFFFFLFLIEKEHIHFYFSIAVLGTFLSHGFQGSNYNSYVLFPTLRDIHLPIFSFGMFLISIGYFKFTEKYFNYPKTSLFSKWIVPIFSFLAAIICINYAVKYQLYDDNLTYITATSHYKVFMFFPVITLLIVLTAAIKAPIQKKVSRRFFLLALSPPFILSIIFMTFYAINNSPSYATVFEKIMIFAVKASVIAMLTLLALSIGYRTNRLKEEKEYALQKNLNDQVRINKIISRFVPNEFLNALGKSDITEIRLGDAVEKEVTVFFSDIRNYTGIAEQMTPQANFKFVNTYNAQMGPIIQRSNGFVNQYLGDGIMAIFPNSPSDALQAAIDMQYTLQQYNQQRLKNGETPLNVGMGMHSGPLIMGITGDENRLDAATISDSVNSASRIENLTKHYGATILLSESSIQKLEDPSVFHFRYLGEVQVKGKTDAIKIYECIDGDSPQQKKLKLKTLSEFEKGIDYYFEKSFTKAAIIFEFVLGQNAQDQPAKLFLKKARIHEEWGVAKDWTGVELMTEK